MSGDRKVTFWMVSEQYGGDISVIADAAKECGCELVAVKGYPIDVYPGDREYVEGNASYLFSVELPCAPGEEAEKREAAWNLVFVNVRMAMRLRFLKKYPETAQ